LNVPTPVADPFYATPSFMVILIIPILRMLAMTGVFLQSLPATSIVAKMQVCQKKPVVHAGSFNVAENQVKRLCLK